MAISPRQIEAFRAVMEAGTVTAAAERLRLSQPAVSKILAGLEHEIGFQLFSRVKRRLLPTSEAGLLHREVTRVFAGMAEVAAFAADLRGRQAGHLRIASTPVMGHSILPDALADFAERHGRARVTFHSRGSDEVNRWVADQQVDLGCSMVPHDHPAVLSEVLCHARAVCVLPARHRLAARERIRPQDLRDETFVSFPREGRMRHLIDAVFEQRGIARNLRYEVYASPEACALVARDLGVAIVEPITAATAGFAGLAIRRFEPEIFYTFKLMRPRFRETSRLTDDFVAALRQQLRHFADRHRAQGQIDLTMSN